MVDIDISIILICLSFGIMFFGLTLTLIGFLNRFKKELISVGIFITIVGLIGLFLFLMLCDIILPRKFENITISVKFD